KVVIGRPGPHEDRAVIGLDLRHFEVLPNRSEVRHCLVKLMPDAVNYDKPGPRHDLLFLQQFPHLRPQQLFLPFPPQLDQVFLPTLQTGTKPFLNLFEPDWDGQDNLGYGRAYCGSEPATSPKHGAEICNPTPSSAPTQSFSAFRRRSCSLSAFVG